MPFIVSMLLLWPLAAHAAAATADKQAQVSRLFLKSVSIRVAGAKKASAVIYGNKRYGYYRAKDFQVRRGAKGEQIHLKLVPPGYKWPVQFFVRFGKSKLVKVAEKQFKSPVPQMYSDLAGQVEKGEFSSNYFLLAGSLPIQRLSDPVFVPTEDRFFQADRYRFTFLTILNRIGEIVWIHVPVHKGQALSSYLTTLVMGAGRYGIMFGKKAGYFEMVSIDGNVIRRFSSRDQRRPFTMHHDFELLSANRLLAISTKTSRYRGWAAAPNRGSTFLSDTIVAVDMTSGHNEVIYDFLDHFHPRKTQFWTGDAPGDKKFVRWDQPKADFDFLHINGLQRIPGRGYLISMRNINKVAMVDETWQKLLWTVGSEESDTYRIKEKKHRFTHQHTPILTSDGRLVLFDNGRRRKASRVIVYQLDKRRREARPIWQYRPDPIMFSKNRSSVAKLRNGSFLVYFVAPKIGRSETLPNTDYMVEVDPRLNIETAKMKRNFLTLSPGYRATPINVVGTETFLGRRLPQVERALRTAKRR